MNIATPQAHQIGLCSRKTTDGAPIHIDVICLAIYQANFRMSQQKIHSRRYRAGFVGIIGVKPCENFALCACEALVNRIRLTLIFFAYPPRKFTFIFFDDPHASIGGAAIHDNVFQARIVL